MALFGRNLKMTIDRNYRARARELFEQALGCAASSPAPDLDLYRFADGCHLAIGSIDSEEALSTAQARKGTWLEFIVENPEDSIRKIEALGLDSIEYNDKTHRYFQIPGGAVFRIAAAPKSS